MLKAFDRRLKPVKSALIWRWRQGFKGTSKTFFDLAHGAGGNYRSYLPDAAFSPMARTNTQEARDVLSDKLRFGRTLGAHVHVPENVAVIRHGEVFAGVPHAGVDDVHSLLEYASTRPLILKPVSGAKGKGVVSLRHEAGSFHLNSGAATADAVLGYLAGLDGYLVTPWVQPAPYAAAIFPRSGNTVRVITMRDPGDAQRPFVAAALHKFGTEASAPLPTTGRGAGSSRL